MVQRPRSYTPLQPPASAWTFPPPSELPDDEDMVAVGADLEPGTLLSAYATGYFPMPIGRRRLGWFHPNPRGILPLDGLRETRSLRRSIRRFTVSVDQAFDEVIRACADPSRPLGWIDHRIINAYGRLHRMGWAHSVEVWDGDALAGGLYGVAIGGLFAGESMFHRRTDASKVALVHLVDLLQQGGIDGAGRRALLDVQWMTPHLETLGAVEVPRTRYCELLSDALRLPLPPVLAPDDGPVLPPPLRTDGPA